MPTLLRSCSWWGVAPCRAPSVLLDAQRVFTNHDCAKNLLSEGALSKAKPFPSTDLLTISYPLLPHSNKPTKAVAIGYSRAWEKQHQVARSVK